MTPVLLRQNGAVANVHITIETLNGVTLDSTDQSGEYVIESTSGESTTASQFVPQKSGRSKGHAVLPVAKFQVKQYKITIIITWILF